MPYSNGMITFGAGIAIVFATFGWLLVHARSLMRLLRPLSDGEIEPGSGKPGPGKGMTVFMLLLHFAGWAVAGFAWLYLIADVRASAPDTTPPEQAGIVDGGGSAGDDADD